MKKRLCMGINIGGPTIITIFVTLCLATLGTLSLITANADMKLTARTADSIHEYYGADSSGEAFLAAADSAIKHAAEDPGTQSFQSAAIANLSALPGAVARMDPSGSVIASYAVKVNANQKLYIEIETGGAADDPAERFRILCWKTVNEDYWNYEDYKVEFSDIIIP